MAERRFDDDTALVAAGDGVWEGAIVEGWDTPRGPLGGYVMAIMLRGLELAVGDRERSARSATMHFLRSPDAGPVVLRAQVEREGRSLTTVSGRLEQGGKVIGIALGAWSKSWESPLLEDAPMPEVAPPADGRRSLRELAAEAAAANQEFPRRDPPPFTGRMTMEQRFGDPLWSGSAHGLTGGWLGLVEERPVDALTLAVLADAWFPAPWPRLKALAPAPTIDLTVHFRVPLPLSDTLLLGRFRSAVVRDGFFDEDGELWTPNGTLVAQSRQLGLLLGARA